MPFFKALNNNIQHDIWGNYQMCRQLGAIASYGFLARKSLALAKAMIKNKVIVVHGREFFDVWD